MDWRNPERVFGSGLDPVVLRALWSAGRAMTGEQVARVAKAGSVRGVRYALGRLVGYGIVNARDVGASTLYEVNTEHLTYPAVDAAFRVLDPWTLLQDRLQKVVVERYEQGEATVALFGSVARAEARSDSDVDVLLVVPVDDERGREMRTLLADHVRAWTGRRVGVYLTTPARLHDAKAADDPIIESFASDAVAVVGPDVRTYLGEEE